MSWTDVQPASVTGFAVRIVPVYLVLFLQRCINLLHGKITHCSRLVGAVAHWQGQLQQQGVPWRPILVVASTKARCFHLSKWCISMTETSLTLSGLSVMFESCLQTTAGFKIWHIRFIVVRCQLWSHSKIYECCYWMQLKMTRLDASIQHNCISFVCMTRRRKREWQLGTHGACWGTWDFFFCCCFLFLKPRLHVITLLLWT